MWNEYGSENVHIVFGDTRNDSWILLNTLGWRTNFSPPLTYWLSIKSQLATHYGSFGDGYVPYNVIIGPGYQVYLTGAGFDEAASRNAIQRAMSNFAFYPVNVPPFTRFQTNTETEIDLSDVFYNTTGNEVVFSVESVSNPSALSTTVNGSVLTVVTGTLLGEAEITVKGTAGTNVSYFSFKAEVYNPNLFEQLYQNFDSAWPIDGWTLKTTGAGWIQSSLYSNSGLFSACHMDDEGTQNDWIYTPKVKINGETLLSFWQKGMFSEYNDKHNVAISYDLNRFTLISYDLPATDDWELVYIDMSAYDGKELYIGFNYVGDFSDVWFIDDVKLLSSTGIEDEMITDGVRLHQNYPNPFNPSTEISFSLDSDRLVKLSVFNSKGESVSEIVNEKMSKGVHKFSFNAEKLNSGIYFYALEYDSKKLVNKMLLIK